MTTRPFPLHGRLYPVVFSVEHIGLHWDDRPTITILHAPLEVREVVSENPMDELCDAEDLPLASGVYFANLKFWFYDSHHYENGYDCEYGFDIRDLHRLRNLRLSEIK